MPKVSIVMATSEDHYRWVDLAINSILGQSFCDFEFIIINDSPNNKNFEKIMQDLIIDKRISSEYLRLLTANLFLNMLPIHIDNKNRLISLALIGSLLSSEYPMSELML